MEDLGPILNLLNSLGVKSVHFHNILPHFDESKNGKFGELVLTVDDEKKIDDLKGLNTKGIVKRWPILINGNDGQMACRFPYETIQINGHGNLGLCNSVIPCNEKYGNIKDYVVWNSESLGKFRQDYVEKKIPQCRLCFRNWCSN